MPCVTKRTLWLGVALVCFPASLTAQSAQYPAARGQFGQGQFGQTVPNFGGSIPYREDPASALARYLRIITANPHDLEALTGAGRAALEVGDARAAIGFYARAEAIAPRNGRIKAGIGSALVLLNQEQAALRYFDDATNLGVPEADVASDRGLAYDLRGSSKRAQHDYAIALKRGADDETTRRMALSLGIGGERDAALALLDPLLRRQDTAAWRARAFILAMTGDTAGASRAAESVMPASLAAGFVPFFRKLPSLRAGEKAAAVHFGLFPGESRPMRIDDLFNQAEVAARIALENSPRSATDAGLVDASQSAFGRAPVRTADAEGQVRASLTPRASAEPRAPVASTPRPNTVTVPTVTPRPTITTVANRPAVGTVTTAPGLAEAGAAPVSRSIVTPAPTRVAEGSSTTLPQASTPTKVILAGPAPVATARVASSVPPSPSGAAAAPLPGFGTVAPVAFPAPKPAPLPSEPAATRLADVSASVREVAREPLVRPTDLPPSTIPKALLPVEIAGTPTETNIPAAPTGRLQEVARVVAQTVDPAGIGSPASQAAPETVIPPKPKPKVEPALAVTASQSTATINTAAPPPQRSNDASPLRSLSAAPPAPKPKVEAPKAAAAVKSPDAKAAPSKTAEAKPDAKEAGRVWVQIAGGADEGAFTSEWKRLKGKAPELLSAQTAWSTPLKATNRLLVGPFENQRAAQDFVNKLAPKGITAFAWTSADGQAITRLAGK